MFKTEGESDGRDHQRGIADGGQGYKIDSIAKIAQQCGCNLQTQSRFTDAARACERNDAHIGAFQQGSQGRYLSFAPNQRGKLGRKIAEIDIDALYRECLFR